MNLNGFGNELNTSRQFRTIEILKDDMVTTREIDEYLNGLEKEGVITTSPANLTTEQYIDFDIENLSTKELMEELVQRVSTQKQVIDLYKTYK